MSETSYIGVQFKPIGKTYSFSLPQGLEVERDTLVVVNTVRGKQIGRVTTSKLVQPENPSEVQPIERIANEEDLQRKAEISAKEEEVVKAVAKYLRDPGHEGVKVVDAEYSLDYSRLTIYLNYETTTDFNPRNFIRDVSHMFKDCRIEVRQVGPRDAAKSLSGIGSCGIEKRCCSRFLTEFSSISIKMAKSQDISLTPMEITGICGRLRCCLAYEHDAYEEARSKLPKKKKVVNTPLGEGKVLQVMPLRDSVLIELPEKGPREFTRTELETGILEEKVAPVVAKDFAFSEENEDVEVVRLESPKPREDRSRGRQAARDDRARQSGQPGGQNPRDGQRSTREQKSSGSRRQDQPRNNTQQPSASRQDQTAQPQEQRKNNSSRRRKSRPRRDQTSEKPTKQD
ncbi:MAG TPA: regulatory iron-sulfur-containing complex subunit RicT [Anaerolineaceae bacterium]|nr:regulatory iron-sulfur-containing complex subunit RicT [Anaerolineaceae bacterium]